MLVVMGSLLGFMRRSSPGIFTGIPISPTPGRLDPAHAEVPTVTATTASNTAHAEREVRGIDITSTHVW
jgi:hypothetical protein